jgi:hypothetical protein
LDANSECVTADNAAHGGGSHVLPDHLRHDSRRPLACQNGGAGTDCGFAQATFLRRVHPSIQWAKLQALVEGARIATKQLWS